MGEHDTTIIGWERLPSGNWRPIEELRPEYIYTAAFINCNDCGTAISSMGGPRTYALCLECFQQAEQAK
jgi:hypothetical protein